MIVVTGGAGFIGSNLVHAINRRGRDDIIVVEDLTDGQKCLNLADCRIADYFDCDEWLRLIVSDGGRDLGIECVYHLGACSDTTAGDGRAMMATNFSYSRAVFEYCTRNHIALVYASSAAVYGNGTGFSEQTANERPLNVYGYSKLAFDQFVRQRLPRVESLVAGVRYFNVYGPREQHKGRMASVAFHLQRQHRQDGRVRLFTGSHGYGPGEQQRDFVYVDDAVEVTLWLAAQKPAQNGIYNCGSGRAEPFNAVARATIDWYGGGDIEYVEFPSALTAAYQAFTQADLARLREAGCHLAMRDVASGVREYLRWLDS